jgi:arginyl-tRNA synthetase
MKDQISVIIKSALAKIAGEKAFSEADIPAEIKIDHTKDPKHGDFASNIALILARKAGMNPRQLAEQIIQALPSVEFVTKVDIAGPGFINFTLAKEVHTQIIKDAITQKQSFGHCNYGNAEAIHIEYVSANPTGPLHVGHGRAAAYGSCVVNMLRALGYKVHNEYYVNDAGRQMNILATSVWLRYLEQHNSDFAFPSNGYKGDYIRDIAADLTKQHGDKFNRDINTVFANVPQDAPEGDKELHIDALIDNAKQLLGDDYRIVFDTSLNSILDDIKEDLAEFKVTYDEWFSEKQLMDKGLIDHCIEVLTKADHLYEKDGALWFKTTEYGDDKDRVVRRANGQTTYFASDIAYHLNKLERGNHTLINVLGADHHGYIQRLKAGIAAMTGRKDALVTPIVQFVSLYRGKEKIAMSTRGGQFVTLRELREDVGNDAARYFYIMRKVDQPSDFDLELAKSQSNENPVYYIQYAHARICSVWRQLETSEWNYNENNGLNNLAQLDSEAEIALCKQLQKYPEVLQKAATQYEPHTLAHYLYDLANCFHSYYTSCKFLLDDEELRNARLCLNTATQQVLANGLELLGLSAPTKM